LPKRAATGQNSRPGFPRSRAAPASGSADRIAKAFTTSSAVSPRRLAQQRSPRRRSGHCRTPPVVSPWSRRAVV
jgi:hypothetical protein